MEECCHNQGNHFFAPMLWDDRIAKIKRRITARQVKKLDKLLHQYLLAYNTASSSRDTDSRKALVKCSKNLRQYLRIK